MEQILSGIDLRGVFLFPAVFLLFLYAAGVILAVVAAILAPLFLSLKERLPWFSLFIRTLILIHELSHLLMAILTFQEVRKVRLSPIPYTECFVSGSLWGRVAFFLIAFAPMILSTIIVLFVLRTFPLLFPFILPFLALASAPSREDLRASLRVLPLVYLFFVLVAFGKGLFAVLLN